MTTPEKEERRNLILSHEREQARQLAHYVIEKPEPRVWMIFIPIFFVFYFWKLKQYESGLKDFAENHLIPRSRALDAVFISEEEKRPVDFEALMGRNGYTDEKLGSAYREWLELLACHYHLLLSARGDSYPDLVRSGYRNKANYLLCHRRLVQTEKVYNLALLPAVEGEIATLRQITEDMAVGLDNLGIKEAEEIFA